MNPTEFRYFDILLNELTNTILHSEIQSFSLKEANLLSQLIKEKTGESISAKSLISYINAVNGDDPDVINPTNYTLNTLAHLYFLSNPAFLNENEGLPSKHTAWLTFKQQLKVDDLKQKVNHKKQERPLAKVLGIIIIVAVSVIAGFALLHRAKAQNNVDFHDDFNDVNLDSLYARGWTLLDPDSTFILKQSKPGHLTLYTLKGNYWVKANERPYQTNTLIRKIEASNFEVEVKIDSFLPYMEWQQTGLFLYENNLNYKNTLYFVVAHFNSGDINISKKFDILYIKNGQVEALFNSPFDLKWPYYENEKIRLYLKIIKNNNTFSFYYKTGDDYIEWRNIFNKDIEFRAENIGISAFHGQTYFDGTPLNADTIPVYYDYFSIKYPD